MKIIFGESGDQLAQHARELITRLERETLGSQIKPRGIPYHATKFPIECDDCGKTFWASDPYASHLGCRGLSRSAGFRSEV